ncbi:MAG: hypothetical protein J7499_00275, partial [Sphingopyxis sp.]|nr:hypothetical protein [Sphingopyxis sp.]
MLNKISAAIGLIAIMGGLADSAAARTTPITEADHKRVAIEQLIQSEMTARRIPGLQLAIVQHGKIIFT